MTSGFTRIRFPRIVACGLLSTILTSLAPAATPFAIVPGERTTYAQLARHAMDSLTSVYYAGNGLWRDCPLAACNVHNGDWGSDALTYVLYLRWKTAGATATPPVFADLAASATTFGPPCRAHEKCTLWSDIPLWDSIALSREHAILAHDTVAAAKARAAFWSIEGSPDYALGACPSIRYQQPFGRGDHLKTLETDSNGIKAALLLYAATHESRYLTIAERRYHAVRALFLDPRLPLYSVYVFDDGKHCTQVPHRFFASVNGNMIWNGAMLARLTHDAAYRTQAIATAGAVDRELADPDGVFADLQAENDIVEPLVEAMFELATTEHIGFARTWLLTNARAAFGARRADGAFGRFFDAPPPTSVATAWQTNGGYALEVAAAALAPNGTVERDGRTAATFVSDEETGLPFTIHVTGAAITIGGTIGAVCCQAGHARVFVDGRETVNHVGIWQNKSSSGQSLPDSTLFAWRWPRAGAHTITVAAGDQNAKEGGSFIHITGYSSATRP